MAGKLVVTAGAGLTGAVVLLALGIGLSGRDWRDSRHLWGALPSSCRSTASAGDMGSLTFRVGDRLIIDLPGSVRYRPGGEPAMTVSGSAALLNHVRIDGERLYLDCAPDLPGAALDISLSGPAITDWQRVGRGDLTLSQIDQGQLRLDIRGSGNVAATGAVDTIRLDIAGSSTARLKDLTARSAKVRLKGRGTVQMTVLADAEVSISGSGTVELSGHPILRRSEIRGRGRIVQVP